MTTTYLQRAALACAAALAFGALSQGALAQPSEAQLNAVRANCTADFRAQCPRVSPDSKQALECLQEHVEHTSQKCQDAVFATMPVATDAEMVPTPPDQHQADQRRADMPPPPPPVRDEPPPSRRATAEPPLPPLPPPAARAAVEPPPPPRASAAEQVAMRKYCRTDYIANCAGIPVGSADALACLRGNLSHLSRACRRAVSATLPNKRTPIVSAPPPRTIPERSAARRAEALAEPPTAPPPAERAGRDDDAPPPPPPAARERADYAPPPPAPSMHDDDAPPPRAERTPPPAPPAPPVVESRAIRAYCGRDFAAHCPSLRPGSAASIACLQRHASRLLPRCRHAVSASLSAAPPRKSRASVAAREELPPPPSAQHRRVRRLPAASAAKLARACRADFERHCRRVRPGAGREIACLDAHHRSLSPRCRRAMRTTLR